MQKLIPRIEAPVWSPQRPQLLRLGLSSPAAGNRLDVTPLLKVLLYMHVQTSRRAHCDAICLAEVDRLFGVSTCAKLSPTPCSPYSVYASQPP